jgi:hypothetical protein
MTATPYWGPSIKRSVRYRPRRFLGVRHGAGTVGEISRTLNLKSTIVVAIALITIALASRSSLATSTPLLQKNILH